MLFFPKNGLLLKNFYLIFLKYVKIRDVITIKVLPKTIKEIEAEYNDYIIERNVGYILYVIKKDDTIITVYDNTKRSSFKITIQGPESQELASKYAFQPQLLPKKIKQDKVSPYFIDVYQQIGSDECGTGDFFGPVVVCAAYVDEDTMKLINELGITDSKKLSDTKILQIVPILLKKVHFVCKTFTNEKYNAAINKGFNLNKIKALGHNYVLSNLHKRCPYVRNIYVDQFCSEELYYDYIKNASEKTEEIIFREKGESYFPSVALASCIARYFFIQAIEDMSKEFNGFVFPLGAGKETIQAAKKFMIKFGPRALDKVCKTNFKNYREVVPEDLIF